MDDPLLQFSSSSFFQAAEVEDDGGHGLENAQRHGEADEMPHRRMLRFSGCGLVVLGHGDHGHVVEQGQQDDVQGVQSAIEDIDQNAWLS